MPETARQIDTRCRRRLRLRSVLIASLAIPGLMAIGGEGRLITPPPDPSNPHPLPEAAITQLEGGRLRIGKVILDKDKQTLTLPAEVNMSSQLVEYFLVTATGKVHESVLRTSVEPYHVHVAMLLLGAKGAMGVDPVKFDDPRTRVPGERIEVEVSWKDGEATVKKRAEDLLNNLKSNEAMSAGPWAYNGSQMVQGSFVAQNEGSIISVITDPFALINNPREGRENDEIWSVNERIVPPVKTPVEVTFRFAQQKPVADPGSTNPVEPSPPPARVP